MNWFDYLLIVVMVLSLIAGLMRGLLREAIGLITWVVAIWIAFHYAAQLEPYLGGLLANDSLRPWIARSLIFLVVLLIGTTLAAVISHFIRVSMFAGMDRLWGALFGIVRGMVVIGAILILCHGTRLQTETWYRASVLAPYGEHVANILRALVGERKITVEPSVSSAS
ncbi:MAG TPA: CvpA family protein [Steroidobacteraceae bacterium]|jgi:membrane protein required for colicin V production|nr:CvpA family protein [Steroidobacteraceae bacterium]